LCYVFVEHHRDNSTSNAPSDTEQDHEVALDLRAAGLSGAVNTVKSLFTNGAYVFTVLNVTCDGIVIDGIVSFGAKYFQQQFGLTAAMAGILVGQSI